MGMPDDDMNITQLLKGVDPKIFEVLEPSLTDKLIAGLSPNGRIILKFIDAALAAGYTYSYKQLTDCMYILNMPDKEIAAINAIAVERIRVKQGENAAKQASYVMEVLKTPRPMRRRWFLPSLWRSR